MQWKKSEKVQNLWLGIDKKTKEETGHKIRFLPLPNAFMAVQKDLLPIGVFKTLVGAMSAFRPVAKTVSGSDAE